ncbi:MAG TPA: RNA polymerase sigma factor [Prolixibacteraceae bacterium]|nr:RNA polymerase sigma factor [Prolixibacteraceae bacterium]
MNDDIVYIDRVLKGDKGAFSYLVKKYENMVYSLAFKMLKNESHAEDLAQEVFIEVFRSLAQFRGKAKFSTWIYRIAYNKSITFLRKNRPERSFDDVLFLERRGGSDETHQEQVAEEETLESLQKALRELSDDEQIMILLHYYEGQSIDEIATVMRISSSNVKIKLFRARKKIKEKMDLLQVEYAF